MWKTRPSSLTSLYPKINRSKLTQCYINDGQKAGAHGDKLSSCPFACLRVCQWNIQYFKPPGAEFFGDDLEHVRKLVKTLLGADADVIVLNEFGERGRDGGCSEVFEFCRLMERAGYEIYSEALVCYPTAVLVRRGTRSSNVRRCNMSDIQVVSGTEYKLDDVRSVVHVQLSFQMLCCPERGGNRSLSSNGCLETNLGQLPSTSSTSPYVMKNVCLDIFGTHLDHIDAPHYMKRLSEAQSLMSVIDSVNQQRTLNLQRNNKDECIYCSLIAGDFNQQRCDDYSSLEWKWICENKLKRHSPASDGVSDLLKENNFVCNFDQISRSTNCGKENENRQNFKTSNKLVECNWIKTDPPPATHWSGTVIDYTYTRGPIHLRKIQISPSNLSDHRLVVCDWSISMSVMGS